MCGLIGIAGNISFKEEKVFKTMLALDVIRGKHSTGVASMQQLVNQPPTFHVVKDSTNAIEFMESKPFTDLMAKKHYILMGHNRHATMGAVIKDNAHPFIFPNVIGAHNGSLNHGWKSSFHNSLHRVVDSEAVYSELNHSDVATMWGKLNGPATLTWIDKRDSTLHFIRNKERPLFWTTANKGQTIVWASEFWMIHVACGREGLDIDESPRELPVNTHMSFDILGKVGHVPTCKREEVMPYVAPKWEPKPYSSPYSKHYWDEVDEKAEVWLKQEGVNEGEEVEFTISLLKDRYDKEVHKVDLVGTTLRGVPINVHNVDVLEFARVIESMWNDEGMVFKGRLRYAVSNGFLINNTTLESTYFTLEDIAEAEELQRIQDAERKELANEIKLLAASLGEKNDKLH